MTHVNKCKIYKQICNCDAGFGRKGCILVATGLWYFATLDCSVINFCGRHFLYHECLQIMRYPDFNL